MTHSDSAHRYVALIAAAGNSARMGLDRTKLLSEIGGRTLLARSVYPFISHPQVERIVVTLPSQNYLELSEELARLDSPKVSTTTGGATREQSVWNGISALKNFGVEDHCYILVHDAARPILSQELLSQLMAQVLEFQALTPACPVVDTLKRVSPNLVIEGELERDSVWAIQTPQAFRFGLLREAHLKARERGTQDATDDSSLVQRIHPVKVVQGDPRNIKITYPKDLALAEKLV